MLSVLTEQWQSVLNSASSSFFRADSRAEIQSLFQAMLVAVKAMQQAAKDQKWHLVRQADREIQTLSQRAVSLGWNKTGSTEAEQLKRHYQLIISQISQSKAEMEVKMEQQLRDREGILAYGLLTQGEGI